MSKLTVMVLTELALKLFETNKAKLQICLTAPKIKVSLNHSNSEQHWKKPTARYRMALFDQSNSPFLVVVGR